MLRCIDISRPASGEPASSSARLYELAAHSLLKHFADLCEGVVIVDAAARIVWMNDSYPRRLNIADPALAIGRPVEEFIPNSLMRQVVETGRPIMLDVMQFGDESFVVTRLPLRDASGAVVGAVGFMLYDDMRQLAPVVSRYQRLRVEQAELPRGPGETRRTRYTLDNFVGSGARAQALRESARRAARTTAAVLILGETGTGKELLAQAIHAASPRADRPFVAVNMAAVPEALLEAEFFGVAPGAYTGAERRGREGKFKLADSGTLFLDELGDMPLALQGKLLRALQEGEVEPLGSNQLQKVDVRVIAATSRNLEQMVADGRFRADLYYRLNVLALDVPPLRERLDDLPTLGAHLLAAICQRLGLPVPTLHQDAIARLGQHDWPGNVRELANVLERALLRADGDFLGAAEVERVMPAPAGGTGQAGPLTPPGPAVPARLADAVAAAERQAIAQALRSQAGNKAQAARALGISRAALYEKIAGFGLDPQV